MTEQFFEQLQLPMSLDVDGRLTAPGTDERADHIRATMIAYNCSRSEAIEKILFENREWNGDVIEIDPLNGKETPLKSDPITDIEGAGNAIR